MRGVWTQPSLSRDFAVLSAAILFVLFLISAWVTYTTYEQHTSRITSELEKEALRIERTLANEMENANYLLTALGKQIILDSDRNLTTMAQMIKSFDSKGYIYSIITWINAEHQVMISSSHGILDKPVDTSDREYVKKALLEPWKMYIGRPIEGRVSGRWIIPVAMGLTDYTGKFIGTIMISMDINTLTEHLSSLIKREGISFAIVSKTLIPLTEVSDQKDFVTNNFPTETLADVNFSNNSSGLIARGSPLWGTGSYSYYRVSSEYPYIILLSYDAKYSDVVVRGMIWSRLLQLVAMAAFLLAFLWIMRVRMIRPVLDMTEIAESIAQGKPYAQLPSGGPMEIQGLANQIRRTSEYIQESKRIESELRNKMFMLKQAKEAAEIEKRSKSEFLAYICQEMRNPLTNIIGFSQVMRDQLYGPIENRKYRQHAADIYQTGNTLLNKLQDLINLSKAETGYTAVNQKPLDAAAALQKAIRFVSDKLQASRINIKVNAQDSLPRLIADEFKLHEIFTNIISYAAEKFSSAGEILIELRVAGDNRDRMFFAIVLTTKAESSFSQSDIAQMAEKAFAGTSPYVSTPSLEQLGESASLNLELAKQLVLHHNGYYHVQQKNDDLVIAIFFNGSHIKFDDV